MNISKFRLWTATVLFSMSFVFAAFAIGGDAGSPERKDYCRTLWSQCITGLCDNGRATHSAGWYNRCLAYCDERETKCIYDVIPGPTPPNKIGGLPTPTPKPGPS